MTNQENAIVFPKRNITWAEVKAHFHLGKHHTVEPVTENKKPLEEMSDAELVASLNRVYNPDEIEAAYQQAERHLATESPAKFSRSALITPARLPLRIWCRAFT